MSSTKLNSWLDRWFRVITDSPLDADECAAATTSMNPEIVDHAFVAAASELRRQPRPRHVFASPFCPTLPAWLGVSLALALLIGTDWNHKETAPRLQGSAGV
jgi:hypothetical protein